MTVNIPTNSHVINFCSSGFSVLRRGFGGKIGRWNPSLFISIFLTDRTLLFFMAPDIDWSVILLTSDRSIIIRKTCKKVTVYFDPFCVCVWSKAYNWFGPIKLSNGFVTPRLVGFSRKKGTGSVMSSGHDTLIKDLKVNI